MVSWSFQFNPILETHVEGFQDRLEKRVRKMKESNIRNMRSMGCGATELEPVS